MNVAVRPGCDADRPFVADLAERTVMNSVSAIRHPQELMVRIQLERLLDIVENASHVTLVAECDGKPAGFILLLDDLPDEVTATPQAFVAYMAVEPSLHGRGVGRQLLVAAENEAKRRGLPYICLMVTEENAAARRLYERGGYVTERRLLCKTL
ncbi:MAG: GNAT family N-acetyltransferase [Candidatus Eremiobacteraeota bacterium]|nr:GNAT family N-acetyltransferase [Candidatus Eremiobacteraeota bacterium]